ncbi:hypothetical protein PG993_010878 [Apiospora rasikravindrae]|uniref:Uncharacterized protein n=1 Tax=Apiospora rasikravindrae TaxID=990691 RepID=A0ABR1SCM5_9PEZI
MGVNGIQTKPNSETNDGGFFAYGQRQVNRVVSQPTRQKAYDATTTFAQERPLTFAFIVSQSIFSLLPLMLFVSFALSTAVFAIVCGLVFSLFWIGIATLVLVPTLFVSFSVAILVWIWAVATFVFARRVYQMIPASVRGDMAIRMPGTDQQVVFQKNGGAAASSNANGHGNGDRNYSKNMNGGHVEEVRDAKGFSFAGVDVKSEAAEVEL